MTKLNAWKMAGAVLVLCTATSIAAPAQTLTTLVSFGGRDGAGPSQVNLVQGLDGAFYGTTFAGGINDCFISCGTAFRVSTRGGHVALDLTPSSGYSPNAGLLLATNGNFYGTATEGGRANSGTVLEITRTGTVNAFYSFCFPDCTDGAAPTGPLVEATDGNFYGTTQALGANGGGGTVFKITRAGVLTTLYSFCAQANCADGAAPFSGLVQATDGSFYGTTVLGGDSSVCWEGCGTAFKVTPDGTLTTLYSFCAQSNCADGAEPYGGFVRGADGNFYGTTTFGGNNYCDNTNPPGCGTIFKMTPDGVLTTLYSFCTQTNCADGSRPWGTLIVATDGNFYGTTELGGAAANDGTIFDITPAGILTTLYSFDGADGSEPLGGLMQATNGNFYGTTSGGGKLSCNNGSGCGTVFSLDTGLAPFVALMRNPAKVGQSFGILGQGFTGTSSVSLNGIPASFTISSGTFIRASVPPGATTGYVTVSTPSGTLISNVPFQVIE